MDRLRPAYLQVASQVDSATGDLIDQVVRAQIHRTVSSLASDGPLAALVNRGDLGIVGAHYDLDTGLVTRLHALGL